MSPRAMGQTLRLATTRADLRDALPDGGPNKKTVGFVPTMGALHEGHLSLVRRSTELCDRTVVSIFVNPTQFAAGEDFGKYPRTVEEDLALLDPLGVDIVFLPSVEEIFPPDFSTYVQPPQISRMLEGEFRPTHFQGVATIVLKLLNLVRPDVAFFGQKDYQQALVVRQMVRDLHVPAEIEVCPIIRDADGLALSSRNRYLTLEQRRIALSLYRCLQHVRTSILDGERDGPLLMAEMNQMLIDGGVSSIDYAVICDPATLEVVQDVERPVVALIACRVGATRLIDNLIIE